MIIQICKGHTDDGCSQLVKKITALIGSRAVIFFFYFRFIRSEIITIIAATAKIASVVIISNVQVRRINHRHHSFRLNCERSKKDIYLLSPKKLKEQPPPFMVLYGYLAISKLLYHIFIDQSIMLLIFDKNTAERAKTLGDV